MTTGIFIIYSLLYFLFGILRFCSMIYLIFCINVISYRSSINRKKNIYKNRVKRNYSKFKITRFALTCSYKNSKT